VIPEPNGADTSTDDGALTPLLMAEGERLFAGEWLFVRGVPSLDVLPPADRPEIAFAGRSNVGKSSLINAVVGQRTLARTSNTPGRTQELNYFRPPDQGAGRLLYLVDMPGYGFAKAPKDRVAAWTKLIKAYLRGRVSLKRVFLLIDARHGIKPVDRDLMELLNEAAVSFQIILTKADKISAGALEKVTAATLLALQSEPAAYPELLVSSAEKGHGIDLIRATVAQVMLPS
jgi:GTP-binding protein